MTPSPIWIVTLQCDPLYNHLSQAFSDLSPLCMEPAFEGEIVQALLKAKTTPELLLLTPLISDVDPAMLKTRLEHICPTHVLLVTSRAHAGRWEALEINSDADPFVTRTNIKQVLQRRKICCPSLQTETGKCATTMGGAL